MTLSVLGTMKDSDPQIDLFQFNQVFYGTEKYVDAQLGYKELKRTAQFRMSSHKYNIETG